MLGEVLPNWTSHTTLLVLSDHGFAPYYRSFNLNTWLLNNGYIKLKSGANPKIRTNLLPMWTGATRAPTDSD